MSKAICGEFLKMVYGEECVHLQEKNQTGVEIWVREV